LGESLPGRQINQRSGGRLFHRPALRRRNDGVRTDYDFFRQSAPHFHADVAPEDPHGIAGTDIRHAGTNSHHLTSPIASQNVRQLGFGRIHGLCQESVRRIQRRESQAKQDLIWTRCGIFGLAQSKVIHALVGIHEPCAHSHIVAQSGTVLNVVATIDPLSYGMDGLRSALIGVAHFSQPLDLAVLSVIAAALVRLGSVLFSRIQL
jgi:hypothetical protein